MKAKYRASGGDSNLRSAYGITATEYQGLIDLQGGLCGACTEPMKPGRGTHLDHCHETGKIRGMLCPGCNVGIGNFREDPLALEGAALYIKGTTNM